MLTWFSEKVEQAQQVLNAQNIQLGFKFNPPATQSDIYRCEEELRLILPNSYKEFLKLSNGAHLFCCDQPLYNITLPWLADSGLLIQSTSSIVPFNEDTDKIYVEEDGEKKYIGFCYLGQLLSGDFCSFDVTTYADSEYKVLDSQHDYSLEEWQE
ncbi:MAG: SMI1/KNR4 family protein [Acaryochloridaceae cyanobacterium CSU_3_4]|nr:SMI1/KNR4 family protein [Acaryochloris sp. SU_5_25]NJN38054.1 SMI1/KNR4 family protein [Acaryochloridaceae cyanobacterium CSU_3_4]